MHVVHTILCTMPLWHRIRVNGANGTPAHVKKKKVREYSEIDPGQVSAGPGWFSLSYIAC